MKEISIIIPVYNTNKEYFQICINSAINQTIKEKIEIIIIDDGSTNECVNISNNYAVKYKNIQVIHQKNQGLGASRNNGMKIATGKWLMFLDSDDWIEKDMCEKLLENANDEIDIIISSFNECYKNKKEKNVMFEGKNSIWTGNKEKLQLQLISNLILGKQQYNAKYLASAWAKLYRRDFINENKLDNVSNLKFKEDVIFNLYCFEYAKKIIYVNYSLYNYRQCQKSLIHKNDSEMIGFYLEYLNKEKEFIKKYNKKEIFYEAHQIKTLQSLINIINKYIFSNNNTNKIQVQEIRKIMKKGEFEETLKNIKKEYLTYYLKIMLFLLGKRYFALMKILLVIRNIIKNKDYKNMYR